MPFPVVWRCVTLLPLVLTSVESRPDILKCGISDHVMSVFQTGFQELGFNALAKILQQIIGKLGWLGNSVFTVVSTDRSELSAIREDSRRYEQYLCRS